MIGFSGLIIEHINNKRKVITAYAHLKTTNILKRSSIKQVITMTKSKNKSNKKAKQQVEQKWFLYYNDSKDVITVVNRGHIDIGPIWSKPNLAQVTIKMNQPQADGFSSDKESDICMEIGDAIKVQESAGDNSIQVAFQTGYGNWILYFYCDDTDSFDDSVNKAMTGFASYQYDIEFQKDKYWDVYLKSLFPTEWHFHSMSNQFLIKQLLKMGVDLSKAREVEHTLFFKHKTDRKDFLKEVKKLGFTAIGNHFDHTLTEHPYILVISRVDKVDWISVDQYVFQLIELTKQHHGFYDGWATFTENNPSSPPIGFEDDVPDQIG